MGKLKIKKDYELYKFFRFGIEDDFNYFYYRNHNIFLNEDFSKININGYDNETFDSEFIKCYNAGLIGHEKFRLPRGEYELEHRTQTIGNKTFKSWIFEVNGVMLEIKDLLDKDDFSYTNDREEYFTVIL